MQKLYRYQGLWFAIRAAMVLGVAWVLWGLWTGARLSWFVNVTMLQFFWLILMPVIVLVMYFSPMLWRNTCPLSTVSLWRFTLFGRRKLSRIGIRANELTGLHGKLYDLIRKRGLVISALLFWLIVPYRLALFNADSHSTFWLIVAVFAAAFVFGALFPVKSGWCTSICPIAAAEKAYGMNPAFQIENTRCHFFNREVGKVMSCSGCTFNCWDVVEPEHAYWQQSTEKIFHDTVNAAMRKLFVATLPGFMIVFFFLANKIWTLPTGLPGGKVSALYLAFALGMGVSAGIYAVIKRSAKKRLRRAEPDEKSFLVRYTVAKRRLDLFFVTFTLNTIVFFVTSAWTFLLLPRFFAIDPVSQGVLWSMLFFAFFFASLIGLRSGWNEKPGPGNYRPNWW